MFANQPVGKEWLSRVTGYSDKPIASALDYLLEMGFVTTAGRYESWQIKQNVFQLSLGNENALPVSSRNNSDSQPTTTALIVDSIKDKAVVANIAVEEEVETSKFTESLTIIRSAGIGEPTATRMAKMQHVNPYYLTAHILQAQKDDINIKLLIHRIRSEDPAPKLNKNFHLLKCSCNICFNLVYYHDKGYLSPHDFDFEEYMESVQSVDSYA